MSKQIPFLQPPLSFSQGTKIKEGCMHAYKIQKLAKDQRSRKILTMWEYEKSFWSVKPIVTWCPAISSDLIHERNVLYPWAIQTRFEGESATYKSITSMTVWFTRIETYTARATIICIITILRKLHVTFMIAWSTYPPKEGPLLTHPLPMWHAKHVTCDI